MIPLGVAPGWWGELQLGQSSVENYAGSNTALTTAALPQHLLERFCIGRRKQQTLVPAARAKVATDPKENSATNHS